MKAILGSSFIALMLIGAVSLDSRAQTTAIQTQPTQREGANPIYKVTINVVERNIKAVNYRSRSGATKIDFRGTALLPEARGRAEVQSKQGYAEINVEFDKLRPASIFGPEYLTYVMWAITPEGRATSLGEVILDDTESKLNVTTELQAFGLIVTAEPYFAVTQPSDVVVMENLIRKDTVGATEEIDAKFELLQRGQYVVNALPADLKPYPLESKTPLDLAQARNALRIATWAGAQSSAPDVLQKARGLLDQAETHQQKKDNKKTISTVSREAVQVAEDARLITVKRQEEARLAAERQASLDREARARAQAESDARLRADAEAAQRLEAERRGRAEAEERAARDRAEVARLETERTRLEANRSTDQARLAQQKAEAAAQEARDQAQKAILQAEREKAELRSKLIEQFNLILDTRDSARGLIVNMSDVLFDTGKYTLKPGAREKLAKVSGIVLAHPGLILQIEGHTDSVGSDASNQVLSERRADAVRNYLVQQRVASGSISARGLGETQPVASNDTASGRQQNRRVELIVSGEIIGTVIQSSAK